MDSLNTIITKEGSKDVYSTSFTRKGSLQKIILYLKSHNVPELEDFPGVKSILVEDKETDGFIKVIQSPLPDSVAVNTYLGCRSINIEYDIAHDETMLVSVCKNPPILQGLFNFTENLTIEQVDDNLVFTREAKIVNKGKSFPLVGSGYQMYNDHFNTQSLLFYLAIADSIM